MSRKNIPKGVLLPFHSGFIGWFPASYSVTEFGLYYSITFELKSDV